MNPLRPQITWTTRMLKILTDYYPTTFNDALAMWLKVSVRTMQRKARELGLYKVEGFNNLKADGISERISVKVKQAYADGRLVSSFHKGERNNPEGEFPAGHHFDEETESRRIESIRRTFRKRKFLSIYGLK